MLPITLPPADPADRPAGTAPSPVPAPITVREFRAGDAQAVIQLVLAIQVQEFGLALTAADQPDLLDVAGHFQRGAGGFWVAQDPDRVLGTLGLLDLGGGHGALRKMFVAPAARGRPPGAATALLAAALRQGQQGALHTLWLGTTEAFVAAHRFYEKHGFERVAPAALPARFPRMAVDSRFYRRAVAAPLAASC